jgi:hypothetical protein
VEKIIAYQFIPLKVQGTAWGRSTGILKASIENYSKHPEYPYLCRKRGGMSIQASFFLSWNQKVLIYGHLQDHEI